ncbi:hypothetical protein P7K49_011947 [Saguinus oedipus]|uniref:Uncharacterized protein n=1 Tax=Saguinus oedipus TaxID=9490 RepID=A0ABQ9VSU6_SAGOE|nr:hypothetical protein P7K49_011947 [Saguinus oedipus]
MASEPGRVRPSARASRQLEAQPSPRPGDWAGELLRGQTEPLGPPFWGAAHTTITSGASTTALGTLHRPGKDVTKLLALRTCVITWLAGSRGGGRGQGPPDPFVVGAARPPGAAPLSASEARMMRVQGPGPEEKPRLRGFVAEAGVGWGRGTRPGRWLPRAGTLGEDSSDRPRRGPGIRLPLRTRGLPKEGPGPAVLAALRRARRLRRIQADSGEAERGWRAPGMGAFLVAVEKAAELGAGCGYDAAVPGGWRGRSGPGAAVAAAKPRPTRGETPRAGFYVTLTTEPGSGRGAQDRRCGRGTPS